MPLTLSCTVCRKRFSLIENLANRSWQRCNACDQRLREFCKGTLTWIEQAFKERSGVTEEIEQQIYEQLEALSVPSDLEKPITSRLDYLRHLTKIRHGDFPHVQTTIYLESDEFAHFEINAMYFGTGERAKEAPGRLIGTNKKLRFLTDSGKAGATLSWNNISEIRETKLTVQKDGYFATHQGLRILVSKGTGGGDYDVDDAFYVKTIMDALIKQWHRQLGEIRVTSRYVPDHIKAQVYKRDGGRCVECGYEGPYLEYDHKYPRSKGGPTVVENIQLLCRKCNQRKADKV